MRTTLVLGLIVGLSTGCGAEATDDAEGEAGASGSAGAGAGGGGGGDPASGGTAGSGTSGSPGTGGSSASGGSSGEAGAPGTAGGGSSGSGGLGCTHVPPGYVNIVNRPFGTKAASKGDKGTGSFPNKVNGSEGWDDVEYNKPNLTIVKQGADGPLSPGSLMRWTYPQGMQSGVSPGTAQTQGFQGPAHGNKYYSQLYFCFAFRASANYYANPTVGNKMIFFQAKPKNATNGGFNNIIFLKGKGDGNLSLQINAQGSGDGGVIDYKGQKLSWLPANTPAASTTTVNAVPRAVWHVIEGEINLGVNDQSDGFWRIWYDGTLTHEYLGVELGNKDVHTDIYFNVFQISPTYGGGGAGVPHTFYWDVDHVSLWGK